jgi:hypothetical protein
MVADSQHTFRFLKQVLSWTKPKLRDPAAADRWTWLILACYAQLWLEAVSPAAAVRHASVGTGGLGPRTGAEKPRTGAVGAVTPTVRRLFAASACPSMQWA